MLRGSTPAGDASVQGGQVGLREVKKNSANSHVVRGNWVGTVPGQRRRPQAPRGSLVFRVNPSEAAIQRA